MQVKRNFLQNLSVYYATLKQQFINICIRLPHLSIHTHFKYAKCIVIYSKQKETLWYCALQNQTQIKSINKNRTLSCEN